MIKNTLISPLTLDSNQDNFPAHPTCVVCLGLGSVAGSSKSQDQLVLLEAILPELSLSVRRLVSSVDDSLDSSTEMNVG